jgi:hypothetical protein
MHVVNVTEMDHIIAEAGYYEESGRPKKVVRHSRGEHVDLSDIPEERLEELERLNVIVTEEEYEAQQKALAEQAAAAAVATKPAEGASSTGVEVDTEAEAKKASGARKST